MQKSLLTMPRRKGILGKKIQKKICDALMIRISGRTKTSAYS